MSTSSQSTRGGSSSQRSAPTFVREVVHVRQRGDLWRELAGVDAVDLEAAAREREHGAAGCRADLERDVARGDGQARERDRLLDLRVRARRRVGGHRDGERSTGVRRSESGVVAVDAEPGGDLGRRVGQLVARLRARSVGGREDDVGDELAVRGRAARTDRLPRGEVELGAPGLLRDVGHHQARPVLVGRERGAQLLGGIDGAHRAERRRLRRALEQRLGGGRRRIAGEHVHAIDAKARELRGGILDGARGADRAAPDVREHRARRIVGCDRGRRAKRDEPGPRVREPQLGARARDLELDGRLDAGQARREHEVGHIVILRQPEPAALQLEGSSSEALKFWSGATGSAEVSTFKSTDRPSLTSLTRELVLRPRDFHSHLHSEPRPANLQASGSRSRSRARARAWTRAREQAGVG